MKTVQIDIDETCEDCKEALKYLKTLDKTHSNCYGSWDKKKGEFVKGLILRPDYNSCGFLTHYHLEKQDKGDRDI